MSRGASDQTVYQAHGSGRVKMIAFCIPTLGRVSMRFLEAHYSLGMPTNVPMLRVYVEGKEVGDARNECVARALQFDDDEREITHIFFLDDDVLPHPEALKKLHAADRDIIAGMYFLKTQTPTPMIVMDEGDGVAREFVPGEVVECSAHGMGLTLIKSEVFKRLRDETDLGTDVHGYPQWFHTTRDKTIYDQHGLMRVMNETEDVYFLRRARALGYRPAVDTSAEAFGWHWEQGKQRAFPLKQWFEFQQHRTITWPLDNRPAVVWSGMVPRQDEQPVAVS
jgi:hypothetical protein